ncbi:MAG: aldehyde dehydrogenase family protein [Elusimicrobia bacterium]|nr:aldehyde dehydrogenase family protein [Elusimicrobiota bacterium]
MPTITKNGKAPVKTAKLQQFIAGKWRDGTGKRRVSSTSPTDSRIVLAEGPGGCKEDALAAIAAAYAAFPAWKATPAPARARVLDKVVKLARERKEELGRILAQEEGKILPEALGELEKGINLLEWYAGEGLRFMGDTAPSELPKNLLFTIREPLGPVSIITPWNFPWAIPCWKMAPALVAGNTVVFKPASNTPLLAQELVKLFEEAGLPAGVLNIVVGAGSEIGDVLVEDERIQAVSFTGSNEIGVRVHTICGKRGIKVTCEMGGKNPAIVWDDADLDLALAGVLKGAFGSTGQRCTATSRLIVQEKVYDEFVGKVVDAAKKMKLGDPLDASTNMGPAVDEGQLEVDLQAIATAKKEGARLLCGGERPMKDGLQHGWFVEPTVFDQVTPTMNLWKEEVFGPVLAVVRVKTYEEAVKAANDTRFGLTCAFYTQDITLAMRYVEDAEVGMVHINSPTIGGEAQVPFGGVKGSGVGDREMAKDGINFFSKPKTVFLDYTGQKRTSNIY